MKCPQCQHGILSAHGCQRCGWRQEPVAAQPSVEPTPPTVEAPDWMLRAAVDDNPEAMARLEAYQQEQPSVDVATLLDQAPAAPDSTLAEE